MADFSLVSDFSYYIVIKEDPKPKRAFASVVPVSFNGSESVRNRYTKRVERESEERRQFGKLGRVFRVAHQRDGV